MEPRGLLAVAGLLTVVSACGGGGGMMSASTTPMPTSTSPPPTSPMPGNPMNPMNPMTPMSVPGEAAVGAFLQTRHESLLHAENGAAALIANLPAAKSGPFHGFAPAYAATHLQTMRSGGEPAATTAVTHYFLAKPYMPLGKVGADGRPFGVVTVSFGFPTTLRAGDSGPVDNLTYFHDATTKIAEAAEATSYTVAARDAGSVRLCMTSVVTDVTSQGSADGLKAGSQTECYAVTPTGAAELESVALADSSASLTLR